MQIIQNGTELIIAPKGRIDTNTTPKLEIAIKDNINNITSLVLDFAEVSTITSACLRVLLGTQKIMDKQGKMVLRNVNEVIREVFAITGFSSILIIE